MNTQFWLKHKSIRHILFGCIVGSILSWLIFLYMYGEMQNIQSREIKKKDATIAQLNERISLLLEDNEKQNEKNREMLTIQSLDVRLLVPASLLIGSVSKLHIEQSLLRDYNHLLTHSIQSVSEQQTLLITSIENKPYRIDDRLYKLSVRQIVFDKVLKITVELRTSTP
ncbi:MAG: sporulation membrane protein YtrI [Bacilli bacterium]